MNRTPVPKFYDLHPPSEDFYGEVIAGLSRRPRSIPPKFFYDETGSRLFDRICETLEYYPARTEMSILRESKEDIARCIGTGCLLVEPGSGNSEKVRILLDAVQPHAYLPMDISGAYLRKAARQLASEYPWLEVHAVCADFTAPIELPCRSQGMRRVAFFPGSSIGNFEPFQAVAFLKNIAAMVRHGGGLLIGVDLKKDTAILDAAYNDRAGITAAFNRNVLHRINRDLGADFHVSSFRHHAFYNEALGRIEMHLVASVPELVHVGDKTFEFDEGEGIHTENSYKYTVEEFQALAAQAGFQAVQTWIDPQRLFSVNYFVAA